MKKAAMVILLAVICAALFSAVLKAGNAGRNTEVQDYYLANGIERTGSANIVNSIVWDFRGYDTLGEEVVLLTATLGILAILRK